MKKIKYSKYFSNKDKIACSCCGKIIVANELLVMMDKLREFVGKPIIVHCVYRCPKHNADVGGKETSQHLLGHACDFHIKGLDMKELHRIAHSLHGVDNILYGGLGYYDTFIHIDIARFRSWGVKL